jgi:hypothetical protein
MARFKCLTCRARVWRDGAAADHAGDLSPACASPLEPVEGIEELVGFRALRVRPCSDRSIGDHVRGTIAPSRCGPEHRATARSRRMIRRSATRMICRSRTGHRACVPPPNEPLHRHSTLSCPDEERPWRVRGARRPLRLRAGVLVGVTPPPFRVFAAAQGRSLEAMHPSLVFAHALVPRRHRWHSREAMTTVGGRQRRPVQAGQEAARGMSETSAAAGIFGSASSSATAIHVPLMRRARPAASSLRNVSRSSGSAMSSSPSRCLTERPAAASASHMYTRRRCRG